MKSIVLNDGSGITCSSIEGEGVSGLDSFVLSFSEDSDTSTVVYGVSSDMIFCKSKGYEYLRDTIWNCDSRGCEKRIDADVHLTCCEGIDILCYIDPIDTQFCPGDCTITGSLTLKDDNTDAFECLESKPYWSSWFTELDATTLPIDPNDPREVAEEGEETIEIRNEQFSGIIQPVLFSNDRRGILVVDAILAACNDCGIGFCSSILEKEPYDKLVILHTELGGLRYFEGFNTPSQNVFQLLDLLKPMFKADYKIIDGKLFFEPTEFFDEVAHVFQLDEFDYDTEPCYQYVKPEKDSNCAYGRFKYQSILPGEITSEDFQDYYSELYEYNDPPVPGRKGSCETIFEVSAPEFEEDGEVNISGSDYPTFVIWNGVSRENAEVVYNADCGYNYPLHLTENSSCDNLFSCFLYKCNPSEQNLCEIELTENLTLFPKNFCEVYEILRKEKTNVGIQTECGLVKAKKIEINFREQSIVFNELVGI